MRIEHKTPFAVLADVHGNAPALKAVLQDMHARGIHQAINLGDSFYGPLDPAATAKMLMKASTISIIGNQDRILLDPTPELYAMDTFRHVMGNLDNAAMNWLSAQSREERLMDGDILCCHGAPGDDTQYLTENVSNGWAAPRSCADIAANMGSWRPSLLLCGHSHIPRVMRCGKLTIVNPGSVGLQAYTDDDPPHSMSTGSPHARYAVIAHKANKWNASLLAVEYDWESAAALALSNGRPDWSGWLRTGRTS